MRAKPSKVSKADDYKQTPGLSANGAAVQRCPLAVQS